MATADIDNDGRQDLLVANQGSNTVSVILNTSRSSADLDFASVATATGASTGIAVDTLAPATPVITSAALTSDAIPVLAGTAEAGSNVTLTIAGATYRTVATGGAWSLDLGTATPASGTLALNANGANAVTATATDATGNVSAVAATQTLTIDTTAPAAPTLALAADTGASAGDGLTNNDTVTVAGLEPGATWQYSFDTGNTWSTGSGTSFMPAVDGVWTASVRQTDHAGNVSSSSATLSFTLDTAPPVVTAVSIPNAPLRIGDVATATISVASDADTYALGAGSTIAGFALGALTKVNATTYTATFTVADGANVAAGADLPVNLVLVDRAGNASAAYTGAIAQGNDAIDATRPAFATAAVVGRTLTLTYSEALDGTRLPAPAAFTVLAGGQPVAVTGVAASGSSVTLTLAAPVANGQSVTVAYADPTTGDDAAALQDLAGNDAATLNATSVINGTPVPLPPPVSPPVSTTPSAGPDFLIGTPGPDRIDGLGGDDTLDGGAGSDTLIGGAGSDRITATPGEGERAELYGGSGPVDPGDAADTITVSGAGSANVWGNGGDDLVTYTASGPGTIYAGVGADGVDITNGAANLVYGGTGAGGAITVRGDGANTVYGGSLEADPLDGADRILVVGNGANTLFGNGGDDVIVLVGTGANTIYGGLGNDTITGGSGADRIVAGPGSNVVTGGAGADRFVFTAGGQDIVTDFDLAGGDRIELGGQPYSVTQTSDGFAAILVGVNGSAGLIVLQGVAPGSVVTDWFA